MQRENEASSLQSQTYIADDIWIIILNMIQSRSHDEVNVLCFSSVSKQWQRLMFSLNWLKVSTNFFYSNYDMTPSLFNRTHSLKLSVFKSPRFTQSNLTMIHDYKSTESGYEMRINAFLARLTPNITHLELSGHTGLDNAQLLYYFSKHLTSITIDATTIPVHVLAKLPHLQHITYVRGVRNQVFEDIQPLDHVELIEDYNNGGARLKNRTGRVIIHSSHKSEGFMVNGVYVSEVVITMYNDNIAYRRYTGYVNETHNPHGYGVCEWSKPQDVDNDGHCHKHYPSIIDGHYPMRHEGEYLNGSRCGKGIMTWYNGVKYDGDWDHGYTNGKGVMTYRNGDIYEGDFEAGLCHGKGTLKKSNGLVYHGDWDNDTKHGNGVETFSDGKRYEGQYHNNIIAGHGILYYVNGDRYDGEWSNGYRHGKGVLTNESGGIMMKGHFNKGGLRHGKMYSRDGKHEFVGDFDKNATFKGCVYTLVEKDTVIDLMNDDAKKYNLYDLI